MENWQIFFVDASIFVFIFQILLVVSIFKITRNLYPEKRNKELLEKTYKMNSYSKKQNSIINSDFINLKVFLEVKLKYNK